MFGMTFLFGPQFQGLLKPWMNRPNPVALGAAGGTFGTALLGILHQAVQQPFEPACFCPDFDREQQGGFIFLLGVLVGICFGPLLDICLILRERWRHFIVSKLFGSLERVPQRPLHKVLS